MDCSKLSANIAAATCRTGRIDVRELMLVNWDDWQKYQREFVLEGQTVPPLFKVTGEASVEGGRIVMDQPKPEDMTLTNIGDVSEPIYVQPGDRVRFRYLTPCSITPGFIIGWRYTGSGWMGTSKHCYEPYDEWFEFPGVPSEGVVYFCELASASSTVPAEYEVIRAHPSAGNDLTLSLSDGITYPPVVSLLATHERGIVSFAEEVKGAYLNGYAHRIQFTAFDRKQGVKDVLNILGRGRFVALARYEQDGEDVVVVYGADCGMVAEAETFDSSNTDGEIGQAVLATDEGCMESVPMLTLEPSGSLATVADAWEWLKEHAFG